MNQETKYEKTIERMRRAGKKYQQRCKDLAKEKKKLWDELADAEEEISNLEEEIERLKKIISDFEIRKDR